MHDALSDILPNEEIKRTLENHSLILLVIRLRTVII